MCGQKPDCQRFELNSSAPLWAINIKPATGYGSATRKLPVAPALLIRRHLAAKNASCPQEFRDGLGGQILVLAKSSCLPVRLTDFKNQMFVDFSPEFTRGEPGTTNAADLPHGPL